MFLIPSSANTPITAHSEVAGGEEVPNMKDVVRTIPRAGVLETFPDTTIKRIGASRFLVMNA